MNYYITRCTGNLISWRQDAVEKASIQQSGPPGPGEDKKTVSWRSDELEIRCGRGNQYPERLGPQAPGWAVQEDRKKTRLWPIEWGSICCSSVRSPTPLSHTTLSIKWVVYFSKELYRSSLLCRWYDSECICRYICIMWRYNIRLKSYVSYTLLLHWFEEKLSSIKTGHDCIFDLFCFVFPLWTWFVVSSFSTKNDGRLLFFFFFFFLKQTQFGMRLVRRNNWMSCKTVLPLRKETFIVTFPQEIKADFVLAYNLAIKRTEFVPEDFKLGHHLLIAQKKKRLILHIRGSFCLCTYIWMSVRH